MPINVPTPNDVQKLFEQLVREATRSSQQMDQGEFDRYFRGVLYPWWETVGPSLNSNGKDQGENRYAGTRWGTGTWRLLINQSIFLISAAMDVAILKHMDGQEEQITRQIKSFFQPLADLMPLEASSSLRFNFSQPQDVGPTVGFTCTMEGIVISATSAER
jgi:hypothetical protein